MEVNRSSWKLFFISLIVQTTVCWPTLQPQLRPVAAKYELDSDESRKVLGSSVVTSVSVIMDHGNGTKTFLTEGIDNPELKTNAISSPGNLLSPDKYEFYTFDETGDLVKRLMTWDEIQGLIAGSDGDGILGEASVPMYYSESVADKLGAATHLTANDFQTSDIQGVHKVVESVQNVLKSELAASQSKIPPVAKPGLLSSAPNWSLFLPNLLDNMDDGVSEFGNLSNMLASQTAHHHTSTKTYSNEILSTTSKSTPSFSALNTVFNSTVTREQSTTPFTTTISKDNQKKTEKPIRLKTTTVKPSFIWNKNTQASTTGKIRIRPTISLGSVSSLANTSKNNSLDAFVTPNTFTISTSEQHSTTSPNEIHTTNNELYASIANVLNQVNERDKTPISNVLGTSDSKLDGLDFLSSSSYTNGIGTASVTDSVSLDENITATATTFTITTTSKNSTRTSTYPSNSHTQDIISLESDKEKSKNTTYQQHWLLKKPVANNDQQLRNNASNIETQTRINTATKYNYNDNKDTLADGISTLSSVYQYQQDRIKSSKPPLSSSSFPPSSFENTTLIWHSTAKQPTTVPPSSFSAYVVKTPKPSKPIPNFTKISSIKPSSTYSSSTHQNPYSTKTTSPVEISSKTSTYSTSKFTTTDRSGLFEATTTRPEPLVTWISTYPLEQNNQKITVNGEILDSDKLVTEQYVSGANDKFHVRNNSAPQSSSLFNEKLTSQGFSSTENMIEVTFNSHQILEKSNNNSNRNEISSVTPIKHPSHNRWGNNYTTNLMMYNSRPSTKPSFYGSTSKITYQDNSNVNINIQRFTTTTEAEILEAKTEAILRFPNTNKHTTLSTYSSKTGSGSTVSDGSIQGTGLSYVGTKFPKPTERPTTTMTYSTNFEKESSTSGEIIMQRIPTINPPNKITNTATSSTNSVVSTKSPLPSSSFYASTEASAKNLTQIAIMMNKFNDTFFDKKNSNKNSEFKNKLTTKPYISPVTLNYITNLVDKYSSQTTKPVNNIFLNDCISSLISNSINNSLNNNLTTIADDHTGISHYDTSYSLPEEKHRIDSENSQIHFQKLPSNDQKENSHIYYYKLPPITAQSQDPNSFSTSNTNKPTDTTNYVAVSMSSSPSSSSINQQHKTNITPSLHYFKLSTSTEKMTAIDKEYQKVTTVDRPQYKITVPSGDHSVSKIPNDDFIQDGISAVTNFLMQTEGRIPNKESLENTPSHTDISSSYTLQNREAVSEITASAKTESDGILFTSAEIMESSPVIENGTIFEFSNETSTLSAKMSSSAFNYSSTQSDNNFSQYDNDDANISSSDYGSENYKEINISTTTVVDNLNENDNHTSDGQTTANNIGTTTVYVDSLYSSSATEIPVTNFNAELGTKTSLSSSLMKTTTTLTTLTTSSTPITTTSVTSDFRNEYFADDQSASESEQDEDEEEEKNHLQEQHQSYSKPVQTQIRPQNSNNHSYTNDRFSNAVKNNTSFLQSTSQNTANKNNSTSNLNSYNGTLKSNTNEKPKFNTTNWNKIASLDSKIPIKNNSSAGVTLATLSRPSTLQSNDNNTNNHGLEYVPVKLENKTLNTVISDKNKPKDDRVKVHNSSKSESPNSIVPSTTSTTQATTTTTSPSSMSINNNLNISSAFRSPSSVSGVRSPVSTTTFSTGSTVTASTTPNPAIELHPAPNEHMGLEASIAYLGDDVRRFVDLCNELSFKIWTTQTGKSLITSRSIVLSPFAVLSTLAMIFLGARGSSSGILNDFLRLDDMVTFNPHQVFQNITESAINSKNVGVSNSAFVREIFSDKVKGKVLEFYKERLQQYYDTHIEEINFNIIGDLVRRRTNLLVKRQTQGRIQDYLKGSALMLRPPLAALTANVFQTNCDIASTEGRDGEMYFVVRPSTRQRRLVPIPAVVYRSGFLAGYEPGLDATAVTLSPESIISTILVLPGQQGQVAPGDGLARLEQRLLESSYRRGAWSRLLRSLLFRHGLELQIPRFSHRSVLNLTAGLQKMGMGEIFTPDKADLRGINGLLNELHLSDLVQVNTFSTCGEETVGARHHIETYPSSPQRVGRNNDAFDYTYLDDSFANTYSSLPLNLRPRQARLPDNPRLRFDRPFLYIVRHNPTGMILYIGRFNPRLLP